eukprot:4568452-Alexandrium_andersonii.AAC.1
MLRGVLRIKSTWGSIKSGQNPISHERLLNAVQIPSLKDRIAYLQLTTLGHVLRRPLDSPVRNLTCTPWLTCRELGGVRRRGLPRKK